MVDNKVNLNFPGDISYLAGYDFGSSTYHNQLENQIDPSREFTLIFPSQIRGVASSFVQGLFENIVVKIGLIPTEERLHVSSSVNDLEEKIKEKLEE